VSAWLAPTPPPGQMETEQGITPVSALPERAPRDIPARLPQPRIPEVEARLQSQPPQSISLAPAAPLPVLPQAEPEARKPEPMRVESDAVEEDGIWKRLQTIFRKHEEKRLSEEQTPAANEPLPVQAAQEVDHPQPETLAEPEKKGNLPPHPVELVMRKPLEEERPQIVPAQVDQTLIEAEPVPQPEPKEPSVGLSSPKQVQEKPKQRETRQAGAYPGETEARLAKQRESELPLVNTGIETDQLIPSAPAEPEKGPLAASGFETEVNREQPVGPAHLGGRLPPTAELPGMSHRSPEIPRASQPPILEAQEDEPARMLQPMPLEAAWPVQRQIVEAQRAAPAPSTTGESIPEILGLEEHAQVREALREVVPGQPTDSPVEVITPRRPRPAPASLQERPIAAPAAPAPESGQDVPGEFSGGVDAVPTEIGALPVDLWNLIGESPPIRAQEERSPAPQSEPPEPTHMQPASLDGPFAAKRPAEQAPLPTVVPAASSQLEPGWMVQRSPEPVEGSDSPSAGAAPVTGADALAGAETATGRAGSALPSEKDLDELAVRVYGEVKKRLAVEWERMRRRF
jgi:hypothetical protein